MHISSSVNLNTGICASLESDTFFLSKLMMSEEEQRSTLVMAGFGRYRHQWVKLMELVRGMNLRHIMLTKIYHSCKETGCQDDYRFYFL